MTSSARTEKRAAKRATIGDERAREQHAEHGAGAAEHEALGEQRAPKRGAAGAERGADRQLAFAAHRSRQDQVGDVRARDDEDDGGGGEQHQQDRPRRRRDLIAQRRHAAAACRAFAGYASGCARIIAACAAVELGARVVDRRVRRQPAEELRHAMRAARHHRRAQVMRAGHDVGDDLGVGRIRHRRLEHADDRRGARAERDRLADHRRIAVRATSSRSDRSAPPRPRPSGPSSCGLSRRPSTGRRPITSKNDPPTTPALTTRGSPPGRSS